MKSPRATSRLREVDEVFHREVHHLLYLLLVAFMDALQQAVDLKDLQAALCRPAAHHGAGRAG